MAKKPISESGVASAGIGAGLQLGARIGLAGWFGAMSAAWPAAIALGIGGWAVAKLINQRSRIKELEADRKD